MCGLFFSCIRKTLSSCSDGNGNGNGEEVVKHTVGNDFSGWVKVAAECQ